MRRLTLPLALAAGPALADSPNVVTDIAPIHSLTAMVMEGVGAPELLMPPNASPHDWSLRPSDAARLNAADLVIWVGEGLTPWLERPVETLASDAAHLELLGTEGWEHREYGEGDAHDHEGEHDHHEGHDHEGEHDQHEGHDHEGEHDHHEGHNHEGEHDHHEGHDHEGEHDQHEGHDHEGEHDQHEGHDHEGEHDHHEGHDHEGEHDHAHGHHHHEGLDPHAWMDPTIAAIWIAEIAEHLTEIDPDHAAQYAANAAAAQAKLSALDSQTAATLGGLSGEFIVPHDAYGYFTRRYDLGDGRAIADQHANRPSAQHISELRAEMAEHGIACIFTDPSTNPDWVALVSEGSDVNIGLLDPIGGTLTPGADLYAALIADVSAQFAGCLSK